MAYSDSESYEQWSDDDDDYDEVEPSRGRYDEPTPRDDGSGRGGSPSPSRPGAMQAMCWQEVDRDEITTRAMKLVANIAATAPTDEKTRDTMWVPTAAVALQAELTDPLGMGAIDPIQLKLVRIVPRLSPVL